MTQTNRIFRAATLVMALFVVSRFLGLFREAVIAYQFGTSPEMDAYLAAFRLPEFLFYVVSGGALGSAFLPVFTGYLTRQDTPGAWRLASAVLNTVVIVLLIGGGLMALFAPQLVNFFYDDLSPQQALITTELMRYMLISTVIFGASGVVMGILNAHQHFLLPALAPVIYNVGIIGGALFLGPTWGVYGLTVGVVIGSAGHLLVQIPGLLHYHIDYQLYFGWSDESFQEVIRLMLPRMVGIAAVQINFLVNVILADGLTSGSLTALNYGWILMLLPQGIIAQSVATALFPALAALASENRWDEMRHVFGVTLQSMLFLTLPATVGLLLWGRPIVRLLLERGEFDSYSTDLTVWALAFFSLGLVGHAVVEIATRAFYALKNTKTPVLIAIISMALNTALSLLLIELFALVDYPPHGGLALANSIAVTIEMIALLWFLSPDMGGLVQPNFKVALGKMGVATLGMGLGLSVLPESTNWVTHLGGIGVGALIYLALAYGLGLSEVTTLIAKIRQR